MQIESENEPSGTDFAKKKERKKRYILTKTKKKRQRIIKIRKYHGSQYRSRARATLDF